MTKAQQDDFKILISRYIIYIYGLRLRQYQIDNFSIDSVYSDKSNIVTIASSFFTEDGNQVELEWRLRKPKKASHGTQGVMGWKIFDVSIAGLSMLLTQREEFTAFIRSNNNDINALFIRLKNQIDKMMQDSTSTATP
ncbi:MAG: ABC transporter substrate-binding protein [Pseudomonadota bacterium]